MVIIYNHITMQQMINKGLSATPPPKAEYRSGGGGGVQPALCDNATIPHGIKVVVSVA